MRMSPIAFQGHLLAVCKPSLPVALRSMRAFSGTQITITASQQMPTMAAEAQHGLDSAKKGVGGEMFEQILKRQEVEVQQKDARIRELTAQLQSKRLQTFTSLATSRQSEIASSILIASPMTSALSAKQMASGIDAFEDFGHPDRLKAEMVGSCLHIHFKDKDTPGWHIHYGTYMLLGEEEQNSLREAVEREITKQKDFFPVRQLVQTICERRLMRCGQSMFSGRLPTMNELAKHLETMSPDRRMEECDRMSDAICRCLTSIFSDLEGLGLDVSTVLTASWQPLVLQNSLWVFGYLQKTRITELGASDDTPLEGRQPLSLAFGVYSAYLQFKKQSTASSTPGLSF